MLRRYVLAVLLLVLFGTLAAIMRTGSGRAGVVPDLDLIPLEVNGWSGSKLPGASDVAQGLGADAVLQRSYRGPGGAEIRLSVLYFARQSVNSQIHSPRNCIPGGGWSIRSVARRKLPVDEGELPVTRMQVAKTDDELDLYYWFRTREGVVSGEYGLKWSLFRSSLLRHSSNAAMVRYYSALPDSTVLREAIRCIEPAVNRVLSQVGL